MKITIHHDKTLPHINYVSYVEGLKHIESNISFYTHCIQFLNMYVEEDNIKDIIVETDGDKIISIKELFMNTGIYTAKEIRKGHNIVKLFLANGFIPKERFGNEKENRNK